MYPTKDQLIIGIHSVSEVLRLEPRRIMKIFTESRKGDRREEVLKLAKANNVPITYVNYDVLCEMAESESHQSVIAYVKGRNYIDVKTFLKNAPTKSLVLMLDQIFDPQNFGALLRVSECFGVDAVIWSKNRGSDITPVVTKASSGASELLPLLRVSNLASTALEFQKEGYELICSALDPNAKKIFDFQFPERSLLVVGSEGDGVQPLLLKQADTKIYIPLKGRIESLNVSQAASILLAYAAQRP